MDNQPRPKRPPRLLAWIVAFFTPPRFRTAFAIVLFKDYTTVPQFCIQAQRGIRLIVAENAREAFDVRRHVGDVLSVLIAYSTYCWTTASAGRLTAILAVAIPVAIWRDAHHHRTKAAPEDAAVDGFLVGAAVLLSQVLFFLPMGSSGMAWPALLTGTGMCTVFVSGWRIVFSMQDPPPKPALKPYRRAWRMTLLWLIGAYSLLAADRQLLASNSHLMDFLLGVVVLPVFAFNLALRAGTMYSLFRGPVIQTTLRTDVKKGYFLSLINQLFRPGFEGFWSQFLERLLFVWIALPMAAVLAGVALGRIPAESVNWMLLFSTAGGFAVLRKTWIEVKKINERAAAVLQEEIDA